MSNNITNMIAQASRKEREQNDMRTLINRKHHINLLFIATFSTMRPKQSFLELPTGTSPWVTLSRILMHTQIHIWLFPPRFFLLPTHKQKHPHWLCLTWYTAHSTQFHFFFHWKLILVLLCINHKMCTILHKKYCFFLLPPVGCELCCFRRKWREMKKKVECMNEGKNVDHML